MAEAEIKNPFTQLKTLVRWLRGDPSVSTLDAKLALRFLVDAGFQWWIAMGDHPLPRGVRRFLPADRLGVAAFLDGHCPLPGVVAGTMDWGAIFLTLLDLAEWLFDGLMTD